MDFGETAFDLIVGAERLCVGNVMMTQFDSIFEHLSRRKLYPEVVEAVYLHQFDWIGGHEEDESAGFELYDASNPRARGPAMVDYITEITRICWKMVVHSHGVDDWKKLQFFPMHFHEENSVSVNPDIHENVCFFDKLLFFWCL